MKPMFTLTQAQAWVPQARLLGDGSTAIFRLHTDTRSLRAGDLFVALKGERFDANSLLPQARANGAVAAVAHGGLQALGLAGLEVEDSLAALGAIAAGWRRQFTLPLIGVTGSNGKTTVTQMLAAILRAAAGEQSLATAGNFNNEIGVPLTLLRLRPEHRLAVVELGMNHPGEIARLAAMARPTVALVNNAQREHQEFMATVEAVARENAAVFDALPADGVVVFPQGDEFTPLWQQMAQGRRCLRFGLQAEAEVSLAAAQWRGSQWDFEACTPLGRLSVPLRIAGRHNLHNALAAVACAIAAGLPMQAIVAGLSAFEPVKGRSVSQQIRRADGSLLTLVDDSYNANPDSVRAAIDVLAELEGPRLLVLGDMGEVGDQGERFHTEVGEWARTRGIDVLLALGDASRHAADAFARPGHSLHCADFETLRHALLQRLPHVASVLVKGSRFMKMERAVQAVEESLNSTPNKETGHAR